MPDQIADLQKKIRDDESALLMKWRRHSGLDAQTRELYQSYEHARHAAHVAADAAQSKVERLKADDVMNPAGRARLIREAVDEGTEATRKAWQAMQVTLQVLEAHLAVVASPTIDKEREALARDELRTRFAGRPNVVGEMLNLAQSDSDMAAVLASGSWSESFLIGQGTDRRQAAEVAGTLKKVAASAAVQSDDPVRRAAAVAREELSDLHKSAACTNYDTRNALEGARASAWAAGVSLSGEEAAG